MSHRESVPSSELHRYWGLGWGYLMPDFDKPDHSIIEWIGRKPPVYPNRVPDLEGTAKQA